MTMTNNVNDLERLQDVLDAHGADIARWPKAEAAKLARLTETVPAARALFNEARALDRALAAAPAARPDRLARLTGRIAAQAAANPAPSLSPPRPAVVRHSAPLRHWPAVAAMAASLLLGVYAGFNDWSAGWVPASLQEVAWSAPTATDAVDDGQEGDVL
jgi:hypothetical protein